MKKTKVVLALACAVLLVAASVMGTLAYLTSTDTVTNTFTVGNVKITLDEAKVNADGTPVANADRVQKNAYKLMPGHEYTKDPTVYVQTGSEKCYLFVTVSNGIANIEGSSNKISDQMATNGWVVVDANNGVYAFGTKNSSDNKITLSAVEAGADKKLFEKFTVDGSKTATDLASFANATIVINAYAIQADGVDATDAANIWNNTLKGLTVTASKTETEASTPAA